MKLTNIFLVILLLTQTSIFAKADELNQTSDQFDFQLFQQVNKESSEKENVLVSPFSLSMLLSMVLNNSSEEAQNDFKKLLGVSGLSVEQINQNSKNVMDNLSKVNANSTELSINNSFWYKPSVELKPNFAEINKTFYKAEMQELKSAAQINEWVSKATKGKIKQIVEELDPEIALYLANTIYFKAHWVQEFDKESTKEQDFTTLNGSKVKSQMMKNSSLGKYHELDKYYENEKVQMLTLHYQSSNWHSERMIVILPKGKTKKDLDYVSDNLSSLLEKQNTDNWNNKNIRYEGFLKLPKFKFDYSKKFNETLLALGLSPKSLSESADSANLKFIAQKSYIGVDEFGTEAAAVSYGGLLGASTDIEKELPIFVSMVVDHPFIFVIQVDGVNLFIGKVVNPAI